MSKNAVNHRNWIQDAINEHEEALLRFATRMLGNQGQHAQDIVQDAFLKLCDESSQSIQAPKAWLYRVVRHRAIDLIRKNQTMQNFQHRTLAGIDHSPPGNNDPAMDVETRDSTQQMLAAVEDLPTRQREAIKLKFMDGLTYREIGVILDISPSHVGVELYKAMSRLRTQLTH